MIAMMFNKVEVTIARPKNLELGCPNCGETEKLELIEIDGAEFFGCECGVWFKPEDMVLVVSGSTPDSPTTRR